MAVWRACVGTCVPEWVIEILARVFGDLPGVSSIIIYGSLGRGEFAALSWTAQPFALSDIEAVVVTRSGWHVGRTRAEVRARLWETRGTSPSPFFSVDYSVSSPRRLRLLPRWFITFEKRWGSIVVGDDAVLDCLPEVTATNIDLRESNETIVWRLVNLLVNYPAGLLNGRVLNTQGMVAWGYICRRNALDFTTWICPHLGIMEAGFSRRVAALFADPRWTRVDEAFGPDLGPLLAEAVVAKTNPEALPASGALYPRVLGLLKRMFSAVVDGANGSDLLYSVQPKRATEFLELSSLRRIYTVARQRPWHRTGTDGGHPDRPWSMVDLGRRVLEVHHRAESGTVSSERWLLEVEEFLEGLRGLLPDVSARLSRFRGVQEWWESHYA